jgi:transcriptional regulator with XRE-family HTH domain
MASRRSIEAGPIGRAVAANVAAIRQQRRLDQVALAELTVKLGRPLPVSTISRIEQGDRRVDVDDLVVLAVALNVDPAALLLPHTTEGDIEVLADVQVPAGDAWKWARGGRPLILPEDKGKAYWATLDYIRASSPPGLIPAEHQLDHIRESYSRMGDATTAQEDPQ